MPEVLAKAVKDVIEEGIRKNKISSDYIVRCDEKASDLS